LWGSAAAAEIGGGESGCTEREFIVSIPLFRTGTTISEREKKKKRLTPNPGHHGDLALIGREMSTGLTRLHKQTPKQQPFLGQQK